MEEALSLYAGKGLDSACLMGLDLERELER